ncbi:flagellar hook-associated protein FlgK [Alkaliphilus sp. B6464]|uniref:flagellar hook-associated protein FlgK n=1 Tax=Alkaliphilus sp. B6464 TaxID=2731219 RepID=UPI001BAC69ED|nr:flagellar hook-associated protein FlgK [Alkaliphilus sp. B6464]QUH19022.1 flagellar hook-associated protein FlgK [Alkaliphilus sp. B6464]
MRSTFSGFNSARSGLFAAQRALDITGHNLANINTRGYTRQRLEQTASTPMRLYGGQGMLGTGVDTTAIHQLRNEFLDYKYRDEASALGFWNAKADGLSFIESIMNEPSDTGISKVIDQLFESFQELSKNPDNITTRTLVRQRAITFTNSINHMYNQLEKMAVDLNFEVNSMVSSINTYGKQIAQLNDQILRAEADGSSANDLRDKRNLLIDDLSKIVDVEVLEVVNPDNPKHKQMVIKVAGKPLVYHKEFTGLKTEKVPSEFFSSFDKQIDIYEIKWADGTGFDADNITGELKAILVMRDGNGEGGNEKGVPYYIKELNHFVNVFANEINKIHLEGFGLDESTGLGFFTVDGVPTGGAKIDDNIFKNINASNIRVNVELEDVNKIAASEDKKLLPKDGTIMLQISELRHKQSMFKEGKPEDFIKSLIGTLGVEAEEADRNALNQLTLLSEIENRRQSISGVWQDEELSNMVKFQHAYNASARMITTIDEMLDVVINKIGIVGR